MYSSTDVISNDRNYTTLCVLILVKFAQLCALIAMTNRAGTVLSHSVRATHAAAWQSVCVSVCSHKNYDQQVAQLSQRDRAAGWVSNGQKWKTGTERQYLRTI